jgi:WD40 repeat protein
MSAPAISPDGKMLAAGCDEHVYLWDLTGGQIKFILDGHTENVTSVDFSPNGKLLASGSRDRTVRLWDPVTGKLVRVISGMTDEVASVKFSSDGQELIIKNWFRPDYVWNLAGKKLSVFTSQVETPDPLAVEMHYRGFSQNWLPSSSGKVLFSPDGHFLALGSEPILLWDLGKRTVTTSLEGIRRSFINKMQYSPNGQWLASLDDLGNCQIWNVSNGETQIRKESGYLTGDETQSRTRVFSFSPDSALLAIDNQNTIEIWDILSATQLFVIQADQGTQGIGSLAFSSDGKQLYTLLYSNKMQIAETWDIAERKLLHRFEFEIPEGAWYAFGVSDIHWPFYARNNADQSKSWIEIWNLETGQITIQVKTPRPETEPIQFSPDGSLLMAISSNGLNVWNTATGQLAFVINNISIDSGIAISSDNKMLVIERYGRVDLWDISQVIEGLAKH